MMIKGVLVMGFSLSFSVLSGCKSAGPTPQSDVAASNNPSQVCARVQEVVFYPAAPGLALAGGEIPSAAELSAASMSVAVAASDLEHAKSVECSADGSCSASIDKPVDFKVSVPVPMIARVKLDFEQSGQVEGAVCMRNVKVGTSINAVPVCIGKFIKASVKLGVKVTESTNSDSGAHSFNAKPYVKGNLGYSSPFFSVGARADAKGLKFDATASLKGLSDNALVKKILPEKTVSARIDYQDLPDQVRKLRTAVIAVSKVTATSDNADLGWDQIADRCDASLE